MSSSVSVEQQSPFNLANRCAVVTGGSTGIGRAVAIALARAGADVGMMALESSNETAQAVGELGRQSFALVGDTSDPAAVEELAELATERLGGIDIWVNNAARLLVKPFLETTDATGTICWDRTCVATSTGAAPPPSACLLAEAVGGSSTSLRRVTSSRVRICLRTLLRKPPSWGSHARLRSSLARVASR